MYLFPSWRQVDRAKEKVAKMEEEEEASGRRMTQHLAKRDAISAKKEEEEDAAKIPIQRREAIRISLFLAVERMKKWLHPPLSLSSAVVPKVGELLFLLPPPSSSVQSPLGGIHGGLRNPIWAPLPHPLARI